MSQHRVTITSIEGRSLDHFVAKVVRALPIGAKLDHYIESDEDSDEDVEEEKVDASAYAKAVRKR